MLDSVSAVLCGRQLTTPCLCEASWASSYLGAAKYVCTETRVAVEKVDGVLGLHSLHIDSCIYVRLHLAWSVRVRGIGRAHV